MTEGYQIHTQNVTVKLDANENPYGLHPRLWHRIMTLTWGMTPSRYPASDGAELRDQLARYLKVDGDQVILGSGSNELIQVALTAFREGLDQIVIPSPSFGMYRVIASMLGLTVAEIPLDLTYQIDIDAMKQAMASKRSAVFLCQPNNPTGNCFSSEAVSEILACKPTLVIADEAYIEFGGQSLIKQIDEYPNLLILRTLSKAFALAGLRVGYAVAQASLIDRLKRAKPPYNVSAFSLLAAGVVMDNPMLQMNTLIPLRRDRERLRAALQEIPGLLPFPSEANFILVRVLAEKVGLRADQIRERLLEKGMSVRYFPGNNVLNDCIRISVGRPEENARLIAALQELEG